MDCIDGDQCLPLLGLAMLCSQMVPDDALVSVQPVLGASLSVSAEAMI
jgi:hypothetical protein